MSESARPVFLMTDFGLEDPYVGLVKAKILDRSPSSTIVDLTHDITPQDEQETTFLLQYCLPDIPQRSIITIVVDPEVGTDREIIAARISRDRIVIVPDTGIISGLDVRESYTVSNEDLARKPISSTFHGRDWFGPVTGYLSAGGELQNVGSKTTPKTVDKRVPNPEFTDNKLIGEVVYVDHFGNMITNITYDDLEKFIEKTGHTDPTIVIGDRMIDGISETYDSDSEALIALFGSFDRLEIARPGGSAFKFFDEIPDHEVTLRS